MPINMRQDIVLAKNVLYAAFSAKSKDKNLRLMKLTSEMEMATPITWLIKVPVTPW